MADNNRNRSNQYNEDWNQQRNRFNDYEENGNRNEGPYGQAGYGNEYQQGNRGSQFGSRQQQMGSGQQQSGYDAGRSFGGAYSSDYGSPYGSGYEQSNYDNRRLSGEGQYGQSGWGQQGGDNQWNRYGQTGQQREDWGQQQSGWGSGYNPDLQRRNTGSFGSDYGYGGGQSYGQSGSSYRGEQYGQGNFGSASHMDRRNYGRGNENYGNERDRSWWDRTKDEVSSWFGGDSNERRGERQSGPYRGKGPKDYRRSEDRIREDVCDRLSDDDRLDATNIQVQIQNNEVILSGTVETREQKRRAEDLVESISGVRNVENRIRIGGSREDFSSRDYTGVTDRTGGIGNESGTTNEIIRNEKTKR